MKKLPNEPSFTNKDALSVVKKLKRRYTLADAVMVAKKLKIDWGKVSFKPADLLVGMHYELEHGKIDKRTDVTSDNRLKTAKIAYAHLLIRPDYYIQLEKIEPPEEHRDREKELININKRIEKKAAYLHPIFCKGCGYKGKPNGKGQCPVCGAQEGVKTPPPEIKEEKKQTEPIGNTAEQEAISNQIEENLTAY